MKRLIWTVIVFTTVCVMGFLFAHKTQSPAAQAAPTEVAPTTKVELGRAPKSEIGAQPAIAVSNQNLDVKSIELFKTELATASESELTSVIAKSKSQLISMRLVEKANRIGLDKSESQYLATELNRQAAAQIILIRRSLSDVESQAL